jgi:hypothetical protein
MRPSGRIASAGAGPAASSTQEQCTWAAAGGRGTYSR